MNEPPGGPPRRRDFSTTVSERAERADRRLTLGMMAAAFVALGVLLLDYGAGPNPLRPVWREIEKACTFLFILLQCLKPVTAPRPFRYLREHRVDYILILFLVFGLVAAYAVRQAPEFEYLVGHGAQETLEILPVLAIQAYLIFLLVLKSPLLQRALLALPLGSATALWTSFAFLIAVGTILLRLPGAAAPGRSTTWVEALFTATSAACVTGLVVVDTGTHWSGFGQAVILSLIQLGGLGILTLTGSVALLAGRPLSDRERTGLGELSAADALPQIRAALVRPLLLTALLEGCGAALLLSAWWSPVEPLGPQAWSALFHAVSAFCNAGFSLFHDSLARHSAHAPTLAVVGGLIVAGGIGFGAAWDLLAAGGRRLRRRPPRPLAAQTRAALLSAVVLVPAGGVGLWLLERTGVFGASSEAGRLMNALFLSISARTAGFQTVDLTGLGALGGILVIALMLVGGAPGSTAGGLKTTTLWAIFDRRSSESLRGRAVTVAFAVPVAFVASGLLLSWITAAALPGAWFEAASAVGTVGLSRGITARIPPSGHLVLVAAMLFGRLGPFVIAFGLRRRARRQGEPVDEEPYLVG
jgi:trk system potassium uptake protein TrkH